MTTHGPEEADSRPEHLRNLPIYISKIGDVVVVNFASLVFPTDGRPYYQDWLQTSAHDLLYWAGRQLVNADSVIEIPQVGHSIVYNAQHEPVRGNAVQRTAGLILHTRKLSPEQDTSSSRFQNPVALTEEQSNLIQVRLNPDEFVGEVTFRGLPSSDPQQYISMPTAITHGLLAAASVAAEDNMIIRKVGSPLIYANQYRRESFPSVVGFRFDIRPMRLQQEQSSSQGQTQIVKKRDYRERRAQQLGITYRPK